MSIAKLEEMSAKFGRRFTDEDVDNEELVILAEAYLNSLEPSEGFIEEMRKKQRHPRQRLSNAMIRGVLNWMRSQHAKRQPVDTQMVDVDFPDGTYTVVFGHEDDRITLRIKTTRDKQRRWVSRLIGPLNTSDYVLVGQLVDCGLQLRRQGGERDVEAIRVIGGDPLAAAKAYGMESGRCCSCGRVLTVPDSIRAGIGPVCAGKF